MQLKELFERIDFFSGLDDKILRKLAEAAVSRQYGKDEVIVRQGEMGLGLYIIVRGKVKVEKEQKNGPPVQVAELGPEQFFAEMSIVDNKPRSATVTTTEDTECLLLTRDSFVTLMQKYPEIPMRVARLLAERLRLMDEKMVAGPPPAAAQAASAAPNGAQSNPADGAAAASAAPPSDGGAKQRVQSALLSAFESFYTMKAFTRFSVAVLGCPVEGLAANVVDQIRVGEVKALLFPAGERVEMRVDALAPGSFTVHVFQPHSTVVRFGPLAIAPGDDVAVSMEKNHVELHYSPSHHA